jgi:hypothetical protein
MSNCNPHVDKDLDLSNAGRGVWLVKVRVLDVLNIIQKSHVHTTLIMLAYAVMPLLSLWIAWFEFWPGLELNTYLLNKLMEFAWILD